MNQLNRALLSPSSMIVVMVVVVSNIIIMSLLSPGNTSGLSSNIQVYNRGELVTISVLFLVLIGLLILLTRTLKQRTKRRRTFSTQTKNWFWGIKISNVWNVEWMQVIGILITRMGTGQTTNVWNVEWMQVIGILITRMGTGQTTRRPIVKRYAQHATPGKVEA